MRPLPLRHHGGLVRRKYDISEALFPADRLVAMSASPRRSIIGFDIYQN
jgi:ABC-type taurine transport system ATPase subunit